MFVNTRSSSFSTLKTEKKEEKRHLKLEDKKREEK